MASVVRQLQQDSLDRSVGTTDLLRKALVVARKLGLKDFEDWINSELGGYEKGQDVPPYRHIIGQPKAWNPYNGWIPIVVTNPKQEEWFTHRNVTVSAAELEALLNSKDDGTALHMPFSSKANRAIFRDAPFESEAVLVVQYSNLAKILDAVRTVVLNWALQLEEQGILGEGLAFSEHDKQQARAQPQSVVNFYGSVQHPQVQQSTVDSLQVSVVSPINITAVGPLVAALEEAQDQIGLNDSVLAEFKAELATLKSQLASPKPKTGILREGLKSMRTILEGAGGGTAAQLAIEIAKLLSG